jgi:hypothetical protein
MTDNNSTATAFTAMIVIGGLIGIISLFFAWADYDGFTMSGGRYVLEVTLSPEHILEDVTVLMPHVVLILSLIVTILGLSAIKKQDSAVGRTAIVCGILVIIAAIAWVYMPSEMWLPEWTGVGTYIAAAAGVLMVISGVLRNRVPTKSEGTL